MLMRWISQSLRRQLVIMYCLPVLVGLLLVNIYHTSAQVRDLREMATIQAVELMHTSANRLAADTHYAEYFSLWKTLESIQNRVAKEADSIGDGFFTVESLALLSADGSQVMAHTKPKDYPILSSHPELTTTLLHGSFDARFDGSFDGQMMETLTRWDMGDGSSLKVLAPVWFEGDMVGVLRADLDVAPLRQRVSNVHLQAAQETGLLLLIGILITVVFSGYLSRIIRTIVSESNNIGSGRVALQSLSQKHDELGSLAKAIASADRRIFVTGKERDEYAETLQAIMDNAPFGIWLTGPEGHLKFVNQTLCDELGVEDGNVLEGRSIGDLMDQQVREEFSSTLGRGMDGEHLQTLFTSLNVKGRGLRDMKVTRILVHDSDGNLSGFVGICEDVTESRRLQEKIEHQATHDGLTGLMNRYAFEQKLDQVCRSIGPRDSPHALCYIDLDQFKIVNDTCGHQAGDSMLKQLTKVYRSQLRKTELVPGGGGHRLSPALARLGGDEFGLLLYNCNMDNAGKVATRLIGATREFRFVYDGKPFQVGCSIGVVPITDANRGAADTLKLADNACYVAKEAGRGRVHLSNDDDLEVKARQGATQWAGKVRDAVEHDRLELFVQSVAPIAASEAGDRFEVLLRYREEDGRVTLPGAFMPAAERFFLMPMLDRWILTRTFAELEQIYASGERTLASASINLSGQTMGEEWLLEHIVDLLSASSIQPEQICFEITETAAISNMDTATELIHRLKGIGCKFSLDDFGSGLSSFSYLHDMEIDYLKIDGSLVKDVASNPVDREMVTAMHKVAQVMNLKTVAEWVENEETLVVLNDIGIHYAQGYHIAKPVPFSCLAMPHETYVAGS